MSNFKPFAAAFAKQWDRMSANEMYRTEVGGDALVELYLASFPEGTNPIFRTRTEHDGSYDKNVIRRIGNVVTIKNGELTSVWDLPGLEHPYDVVAKALSERVKAAAVRSLFRLNDRKLGHLETYETLEDGSTLTWNHFYAAVADRHFSNSPEEAVSEPNTTAAVFKRGLEELRPEAFELALDLIESKSVYRGEEFRKNLSEFAKVQAAYLAMGKQERNTYIWNNIAFPYARLRSTAVGTFLIDLSEGEKSIEVAVESFGKKLDPANYKRPTAIISQGMVNQAMKTIQELDLEPSLERRHARLSDVNVNDVLWVSNAAQAKMKGGLESLLASEVARPKVNTDKAEDISIDDFMGTILPHATTLDVLFKNGLQKNLASITAPVHENTTPLFKWGNDFAWSYKGNIADSEMRAAVVARGGSVTGAFRFTHQWNYGKRNASLMDLHVFMPGHNGHGEGCHDNYGNDERVGWNHRGHTKSGGKQDVDHVAAAEPGFVPVENITFPTLSRMPDGDYTCKVHNWNLRAPTEGGFRAEIEFDDTIYEYEVDRPLKMKEWVPVATVTKRGDQFTITHHLPCGQVAQEAWGLKTEGFVPVSTVMLSPNYWGEAVGGNKHFFFLLDGARNDEPTRGIYNEFLRNDLTVHGKVFEVLGTKTKCAVVDEQLSGLGFSSTKSDSVIVRVGGQKFNKLFNIKF